MCSTHYQGGQPPLTVERQQALKMELKTRIYNTAAQGIAWVEKQFGVTYSTRGMQTLLKRLGLTYKKNRLVPIQPTSKPSGSSYSSSRRCGRNWDLMTGFTLAMPCTSSTISKQVLLGVP